MAEPLSFREKLQGDLDARYSKLIEVIDSALEAKTLVWLNCPSCKKRSQVEVQDVRASLAAGEFFANQSLGRPGVDDRGGDATEERIVFERVLHLTDAALEARVVGAAGAFVDAARLDEFLAACGLGGPS